MGAEHRFTKQGPSEVAPGSYQGRHQTIVEGKADERVFEESAWARVRVIALVVSYPDRCRKHVFLSWFYRHVLFLKAFGDSGWHGRFSMVLAGSLMWADAVFDVPDCAVPVIIVCVSFSHGQILKTVCVEMILGRVDDKDHKFHKIVGQDCVWEVLCFARRFFEDVMVSMGAILECPVSAVDKASLQQTSDRNGCAMKYSGVGVELVLSCFFTRMYELRVGHEGSVCHPLQYRQLCVRVVGVSWRSSTAAFVSVFVSVPVSVLHLLFVSSFLGLC